MVTSTRPDTRTHLVNTATDLFLGRSYGSVSTSRICEAAEVNKGTFYHFFPSKASLLIASMNQYADKFTKEFGEIVQRDMPATDKLKAIFEVPAGINRECKETGGSVNGCLLGNIALELSTVDQQIKQAAESSLRVVSNGLKPIVEEFIASEQLPLDAQFASDHVLALIQGSLLLAKVNNNPDHITAMATTAPAALRSLASAPVPESLQ